MSHKINSNAMRMGISKTWKSKWYAEGDAYKEQLHQDLKIKKFVAENLDAAGLDSIEVSRSAGKVSVDAFVARPGVAIGRGGTGIEDLNKKLKQMLKLEVDVKVKEVQKPDLSANILASEIVSGLKRRMPAKMLAQAAIEKAMGAGAKGIRVWIAGRINGAQQARTVKFSQGAVPLHTLKANIEFCSAVAQTGDLGKFGVKVWVYRESKLDDQE
ncbi:MAG: 30S ribosomal protein S3 [Candidatus Dojkabacteria bacterium]|nr:MAG: 30S ribosomal protein S3 [Candidatus Dojkabacteria bacterium]